MGKARWMTGSLVGLALLAGGVTPAQARPRYGHGGGWHHHRDRDGFGFGDAVGIAALVGAVAIVASSVSKDKNAPRTSAQARNDDAPPRNGTDYGRDTADAVPARDDADFSDVATGQDSAMTDACALAARDEAQDQGGYAEIRRVDTPQSTPDGGYNIDGEVETRASWSANGGQVRRFTCAMKDGRVADVYLSRDVAAAR